MESETASAADKATATQQLLVVEEYELGEQAEGEEKVGTLSPPRTVPRLQDNSSLVDAVEGQLGVVESHDLEPIATAIAAVEAEGCLLYTSPSPRD